MKSMSKQTDTTDVTLASNIYILFLLWILVICRAQFLNKYGDEHVNSVKFVTTVPIWAHFS